MANLGKSMASDWLQRPGYWSFMRSPSMEQVGIWLDTAKKPKNMPAFESTVTAKQM